MARPCSGAMPRTLKNPPVTIAYGTCSAAPSPLHGIEPALKAAISVNEVLSRRQSVKSGGDAAPPGRLGRVTVVEDTCTSCSGAGNGIGRNSTARTALKIAALAPIPIARVNTVTTANPGFLVSVRIAYL